MENTPAGRSLIANEVLRRSVSGFARLLGAESPPRSVAGRSAMIDVHWLYLGVAGLFEIGFTYCLKRAENFRRPFWTALFLVNSAASFWLLNLAIKGIELGTAYAVWTGIGAAGTAILGILLFGEPATWLRGGLIATLIAAVIGLKVVS